MKPIWRGSISFGLVSIPITLYKAVQENVFGFTLLCATCHNPVHYVRRCTHCNKDVAWNEVVRGLEIRKGEYIILDSAAIKKLKAEKTSTIDILEFIPLDLIAPIYYEHHYYVAPQGADKAFFLFQHALQVMKKVAIGQFVLRDKKYIVAIQAYEGGILLSTLNYAYEIRSMEKVTGSANKKAAKFSAPELKLAMQLIQKLSKDKFDITHFKDDYAENLKKLIQEKSKVKSKRGKKRVTAPKKLKKSHTLLDSLHDSLVEARA